MKYVYQDEKLMEIITALGEQDNDDLINSKVDDVSDWIEFQGISLNNSLTDEDE